MMMREPGFMGLAKERAKKQGMLTVPKRYQPDGGGPEEYPAFVNEQEMAMLKKQGGKGFMTPYGVPSFQKKKDTTADDFVSQTGGGDAGNFGERGRNERDFNYSPSDFFSGKSRLDIGGWMKDKFGGGGGSGTSGDTGGLGEDAGSGGIPNYETGRMGGGARRGPSMSSIMTPEQIEAKRKADARAKYDAEQKKRKDEIEAGRTGRKRRGYIEGRMVDAEGRTKDDMGVMTDAEGRVEGDEGFDFETAELKGGFDESTAKLDTTDSYEDYKQQAKGLGSQAKGITDQFGKDADTLAGYQSGFDQMATEAKTRGDAGESFQKAQGTKFEDTATTGAGKLEGIAGEVQTAAQSGADAYGQGADAVAGVQEQFGKEGFQKDIRGLSEQALSTDLGQRDAAMLKGQMEESRMASQKGSEEKLRRELAQSGASPAEIAAKVAQFQQSSAANQAQASRSEALQSTLQGQQMGQSRLGQAAQLKGQEAGMAGQQASLGAQQAALRGQGAAMQMQGAGQRAGIQGQATGMQMQGIQGGAAMNAQGTQIGMQGANQQAAMMGQGMGAVQAAGAARGQQMQGLQQQGGFIDQQGQYTQAQLNDLLAQETQAYNQQQAELTRQANAQANSGGGGGGGGGLLGGVTRALGISDARLKQNIKLIKKGKGGDPNIYSFNYIWDNNITWSGVMAQDLLKTKNSDAVKMTDNGFYMVDYGKLGIEMKQLST